MSGTTADDRVQLDIRALIAKIDRDRAETQKLYAEGRKFQRDPWVLTLAAFVAAIAAIAARLPEILHAFGVTP